MNIPENLKYTASHEWVEFISDTRARVGITDYAQSHMGDIVFIRLPEAGDAAVSGEPMAELESVKAVSDIFSPVTGRVAAANAALEDAPEAVNADPYAAWIAEIEDISATSELLDAAAYLARTAEEA